MCTICKRKKKNLFTIDYQGEQVKACSICITDNLLTGWSK